MCQRFWWVAGLVICLAASRAAADELGGLTADDQENPPTLPLTPQPILPGEAKGLAPLCGVDHPVFADDSAVDNNDSVYAVPTPPGEDDGVNSGAAHIDLNVIYFNRYIYRGVDHDTVSRRGNALNLTLDAKLSFDTGQWPHPFFGVFTNIYDSDPVSRFQEIRPYVGADWTLRPFLLEGGLITYIYPERESFNTAEIYGKIGLDDSLLFGTEKPVVSPYFLAAYDYTQNNGWYFEVGLSHDFVIEEIGLTITPKADVAYINHFAQNFVFVNNQKTTGWQHMDVGFETSYSLNTLLNVSRRFGQFDLKGYIFYTERMSQNITATDVVWGGGGIGFRY